jgi:hypothetical protein
MGICGVPSAESELRGTEWQMGDAAWVIVAGRTAATGPPWSFWLLFEFTTIPNHRADSLLYL